jgi:hypothetical protein
MILLFYCGYDSSYLDALEKYSTLGSHEGSMIPSLISCKIGRGGLLWDIYQLIIYRVVTKSVYNPYRQADSGCREIFNRPPEHP